MAYVVASASAEMTWVPKFLYEDRVRALTHAVYNSFVGSSRNATLFLTQPPENLDYRMATGSHTTRHSFYVASKWLSRFHEFEVSEELYSDQVLSPVRIAAWFTLEMRKLCVPTCTLNAFIFSKSHSFFSRNFEDNVTVLSMIIPELQMSMSLRCRSSILDYVNPGCYSISGIQPVPFVNRVHPTRVSFSALQTLPTLKSLSFLNTAFEDVPSLGRSLALEHFCEMESPQQGIKRYGAPCMIAGRLLIADPPMMTIQSPRDPQRAITAQLTKQCLTFMQKDQSQIRELEGKFIRVLCVVYYSFGPSNYSSPEPEIYMIEEISSLEALKTDCSGYVRLRHDLKLDSLGIYSGEVATMIADNRNIWVSSDGSVSWKPSFTSSDPYVALVARAGAAIRTLRSMPNLESPSNLILSDRLIDHGKLRVSWLCSCLYKQRVLLDTLLDLFDILDIEGSIPSRAGKLVPKLSCKDPKAARESVRWLYDVGLIVRLKDGRFEITPVGHETALAVSQKKIESLLPNESGASNVAFGITELSRNAGIPESLAMELMQSLEEQNKASCAVIHGRRCETVWVLGPPDSTVSGTTAAAANELNTMLTTVLRTLGSVWHPLSADKIAEELRNTGAPMSKKVLMSLLEELRAEGKLTRDQDMWSYPWKARVVDLFLADPSTSFETREIMTRTGVPPSRLAELGADLHAMRLSGTITEVFPDWWTLSPKNEVDKKQRLLSVLKKSSRSLVVRTIKQRGGRVPYGMLRTMLGESYLDFISTSHCSFGPMFVFTKSMLEELVQDRVVVRDGNWCFLTVS